MKKAGKLFLGLMSGTSMDGIDAAVVRLGDRSCEVIAGQCMAYPDSVRKALRAIRQEPETCSIDQLGQLDSQVGECFAAAAKAALDSAGARHTDIVAIGSHGQTLRHLPDADPPFTLQIGDPNIIAARTGITVVADFRRRDVAEGGQGAPLAPAFHSWLLADEQQDRAVLNIGGIANLTALPAGSATVTGFDTGPGNTLLDAWISQHRNIDFDDNGDWAARGQASDELLDAMLQDPYFALRPPKSTGFEYFNLAWLAQMISRVGSKLSPQDVQATLLELTCRSVADAVRQYSSSVATLFICGGGVHNKQLVLELGRALTGIDIRSTATQGLDPDWVEAAAFAWLARCRIEGSPGNLPSVTGASRSAIIGSIFSA
ncbi:MAG: anhydro-N-acetylmuramic acid kinase [Gammaproteobacteria bacterium]|nr:anhydro-N-acetylmuramic acid kinase [Gammaproteobacteria bacterium]MDH4314188.1 anhydro-N-acetylmuramic acid kinase [Gammaproteobacteria bacterium]MDH5213220.1 anhydro-N-acetylmuramic acid kinase [Gammaproteobacteria bacterium]MDH5500490.1 anhydro-N-acetylmuramic acid kinase [Gammaproteobacteria bacterium]